MSDFGVKGPFKQQDSTQGKPESKQEAKRSWFSHKLSFLNFSSKSEVEEFAKPQPKRIDNKRSSINSTQDATPSQTESLKNESIKQQNAPSLEKSIFYEKFLQMGEQTTLISKKDSPDYAIEKKIDGLRKNLEQFKSQLSAVVGKLTKEFLTTPTTELITKFELEHNINKTTKEIEVLKKEIGDPNVLKGINLQMKRDELVQKMMELTDDNHKLGVISQNPKKFSKEEQLISAWYAIDNIAVKMHIPGARDGLTQRLMDTIKKYPDEAIEEALKSPVKDDASMAIIDRIKLNNPTLHEELLKKYPALKS